MSREEWYRRSTWTEDDREQFNERLKRSRGSGNKAQYLRIQASHLAEAGLHAAAIELIDRMLAEFPERIQLAQAHSQKAASLAKLGQDEAAIHEYRAALDVERAFPNVRTQAWLNFGCFAVERELTELYEEVHRTLVEFHRDWHLRLPNEEYRYYTIRAILADARGDGTEAAEFAKWAIAHASKNHSGLRYHPTLGLVGAERNRFETKLKALAGNQPRNETRD